MVYLILTFLAISYLRFAEGLVPRLVQPNNESRPLPTRTHTGRLNTSPYTIPFAAPKSNFIQEQNWSHQRETGSSNSQREPTFSIYNNSISVDQPHRMGLSPNSSLGNHEILAQMKKWMLEFRDVKSSKFGHNNKTEDDMMSAASSIIGDDQDAMAGIGMSGSNDEESEAGLAGSSQDPQCAHSSNGVAGRYYCTSKEDYPLKLVTEVTKYYKWPLEKLFRDLHAQIMPKLAQETTGNLVCDSITRVVRPGWARNTNDRWLVVINTENYHQYVTEVVCQYGSNSRCNFMPPCYYSTCQQRFNTQKLLVIDPNNPYRGPFLSEFLFPSCCVCYVPSVTTNGIEEKYGKIAAPTTIYQQTVQQVSQSNIYPPTMPRPGGSGQSLSSSISMKTDENQQSEPNNAGEIRRDGENPGSSLSSTS